ncbi:MAG: phosphogluconate dehydratase [Proteobacteria bacterium]|nr:phosphogluconate dehydratase [Pseudomonadota bacterium]
MVKSSSPVRIHPVVREVTERIRARSSDSRAAYLEGLETARARGATRARLSCGNLAHVCAASGAVDRERLQAVRSPNLAIVSAYNDLLSAHQPLEAYPALLKEAARAAGAVAQFAGGVPAMCDGVTQGQPGMELSLMSRDVIALATAVALTHDAFDGVACLGVCDKIVPGLLIGALSFGHLPAVFVPAGPMPSGLANAEKARVRREYAAGRVGRDALLEAELRSYHAPGTCTFYGTANSNQMLMEAMGLHVPGSAFVPPGTPLRDALTGYAAARLAAVTALGRDYRPVGRLVDERTLVNAVATLLATGGSTNHTIHLVAIARAAGLELTWDDFDELAAVVPLIARVYPNGEADVNRFHAAGGTGFVIRELIHAGLLHGDARTLVGDLAAYAREPYLGEGGLAWRDAPAAPLDRDVLRPAAEPFNADGGIRVLRGNLGRSVIKTSALRAQDFVVEAPAAVFESQEALAAAFRAGALERDVVAVVRGQGPRANGMPELHQLTPVLGALMSRGHRVALVTDGRMSGASGPVPAALHVTPESVADGPLARVRDGDRIRLDARRRELELCVPADELARRPRAAPPPEAAGYGRELFTTLRRAIGSAESGAVSCQ